MRLPPLLAKELEPHAGRWEIELGAKHYKILIDGRMAAIFPRGSVRESEQRATLNVRAQIRRHLKGAS